jgi:hypothetical protein
MKNFGIKTDRANDYLVGKVKSVTIKIFDIKEGIKELNYHSMNEYNFDGHRCLSLYYKKSGGLRLRQVFRFDNDGNKIGYTNYNTNGLRDGQGIYELDNEGKIVNKFHDGEHLECYEYDDNDNITEVFYNNTGDRDIYEYDNNGLVIKQLSLSGESSMFGNIFGGPKKKLTTYVNDRWGNIIEMKVYNAETRELLFTQKNTINNQGDEIESIGYKADGLVHAHMKYEYIYDNNGNWILQKTTTKDGRVYNEHEREITYHSDITETVPQAIEELTKDVWRFKRLDGQELAFLTTALMKNLFPKPQKGQLLVKDGLGDGSCILYFESSYFTKLTTAIRNSYNSGAFAKSNAEDDWNDLMYAVESANPVNNIEINSLRPHFLTVD